MREGEASSSVPSHDPSNLLLGQDLSSPISLSRSSKRSLDSIESNDSGYSTAPPSRPYSKRYSKSNAPNRDYILELALSTKTQKHPATFQCHHCPKRFNRAYNLRSHIRIHTEERPFICSICGKAFARQHDLNRHHDSHLRAKRSVCRESPKDGHDCGRGRIFAEADARQRQQESKTGFIQVQPSKGEDAQDKRARSDSTNSTNISSLPDHPNPSSTQNTITPAQMPPFLPQALLQQYPCLAEIQWDELDVPDNGWDADISGPSSFDSSSGEVFYEGYEGCGTTKTNNLPDQASEDEGPWTIAMHGYVDESSAIRIDTLSSLSNASNVSTNCDDIEDHTKEESTSEITTYAAEEPANTISASEPPQFDCIHTLTPPTEGCATPSTILDDDMTETDEEPSEPGTSFSSGASSTSLWPSSPKSAEGEGLISPILDESRRQVVDRLMMEVLVLLNRQIGIRSRTSSAQSSRDQSFQQDSVGESAWNPANKRKRARNDDDSGSEMPNDGSGDGGPSKSQKTSAPTPDDKSRKLACPYYKRNPGSHQKYRSCAGPGWSSCHRVKEHIYRRHKLPIRCIRCCTDFPTDKALSDHLRQPESCTIQRAEPIEGMEKLQEVQLRSRKRLVGTEEQRWKEMFLILFPDDDEDTIPSPHYEPDVDWARQSDQLAEYDRYLARELPRRVRTQLEAIVLEASVPLESGLQSQLIDIIRNCQRELFRSYAANRDIQVSTTDARPGPSNEIAPLDAPPMDAYADINAFWEPPSLLDSNYLFTNEDLFQNSGGLCPHIELSSFDSGYGSQNANIPDGSDALPQNSSIGGQLSDGTTDILSQFPDLGASANIMQSDDPTRSNSTEPWSSFGTCDWMN